MVPPAYETPVGHKLRRELEEAQAACIARLVELRRAVATCGGILCGMIGVAAIIAAFA